MLISASRVTCQHYQLTVTIDQHVDKGHYLILTGTLLRLHSFKDVLEEIALALAKVR